MSSHACRALCAALVLAALVASGVTPAGAAAQEPPRLDARAWVLVDAADGERLAGRAVSRELPIASATKLMTAYVSLVELSLRRRLTAPRYRPSSPLESLANLNAGERMSVRDLLYALLHASANDAAVTLARGVSGSVPRFVREMNRTAAALGLTGTEFQNPIGLDSPRNYSTAGDLAALTLRLRREGIFRRIVATPSAKLRTGDRTREIQNRNTLLRRAPWVNGVKTGHTSQARYVLVGSGTRKGATLVSVVLGAPSEAARDAESLKLLEYGFSLYRSATPVREGERLGAPELRFQDTELPLVAARDLRVPVRRGQDVETLVSAPEEVEGPIDRGQELGRVTATVDGEEVGTVPLVAARAAGEASLLQQARGRAPAPGTLIAIGASVILIGVVAARRGSRRRPRGPGNRTRSYEERMQRREPDQVGERERERR